MAIPSTTINPTDLATLLQLYQTTAGKIDSLMFALTLIAAVFGVIIAIVLASSAIRQINIDREIRAYKDDIKEQKERIIKEIGVFKAKLAEDADWAKEQKGKIETVLATPASAPTKKDLEKLKNQLEQLQEEVAFKRGSVYASTSPSLNYNFVESSSIAGISSIGLVGTVTCKKCGETYFDNSLKTQIHHITFPTPETSICPKCGNVN